MPESTPIITNDPSVGPNDAVYAAIGEAAAQQAEQADKPVGEFDFVDASSANQTPATSISPAPLAGKFKDAAELEKAYIELQRKFSQAKPQAEPANKPADVPAPDAAKSIAPEMLNDFVTEYRTNNGLSDDSYSKLQQMGLSKGVVDAYIEGQKAVADRQAEAIYNSVGGRDQFQQVIEWAGQNLPVEEQEAFNGIMSSGDPKAATFAIRNLAARWSAEGRTPTRIEGKASAVQVGFRSQNEMVAALTDPRYGVDPAYRQEVARKMAISQFIEG
jgi:hypothetical protein